MRATRSAGWVFGTVVLILAIFAGTWFFAASPRFEDAAETASLAEDTRSRNDLLELENAQLKADFANLDTYKAELAELQAQIPLAAELSDYSRTIDAIAVSTGVFVTAVSPGVPTAVTFPTPLTPAPEPEPTSEETETDTVEADGGETGDITDVATNAAADEPTAQTGPTQIDGFVAVPFQITVVGPYANVSAFLGALQTGQERLFLVTGVDAVQQDAQDASGGRPAVAAGDLELTVRGFTYVLQDPSAPTPVAPASDSAEVPLPASDRNPFAPLVAPAAEPE